MGSFRSYFLFCVLCTFFTDVLSAQVKHSPSECEKKCPSSFSQQQRRDLCSGSVNIGPAECAYDAKMKVNMKFDQILDFCDKESSSSRVACLLHTSKQDQNTVGKDVCRHATTPLPGQCWSELSPTNKRLHSKEVMHFCQNCEDYSEVSCVTHILGLRIPSLPLADVLSACAMTSGIAHDVVAQCTNTLKPHISNSFGFTATHFLQFCTRSSHINATDCLGSLMAKPLSSTSQLTRYVVMHAPLLELKFVC